MHRLLDLACEFEKRTPFRRLVDVTHEEATAIRRRFVDALRSVDQHRGDAEMREVAIVAALGVTRLLRDDFGSSQRVFNPVHAALVVGAAAERIGLNPAVYIETMILEVM